MATLGASDYEQAFVHLNRLGLTADTLPVVWNRDAPISPLSKLTSIGKIPSVINPEGFVTGISGWTKKQTSSAEVQAWARDPRYGVALQTRLVRGLDIDIDDTELAHAVAHVFEKALGFRLPRRGRPNSGKMLLAFELEGHLKKRVIRCSGGIIELLGTGQQFIFDSIHVSGERYTWEGGLPAVFPKISQLDLERAWRAVEKEFAIGKSSQEPPAQKADARGKWLLEHWPNHGYGSNGHLHIECPFKAGHSSDGGVSECSYLAAGTNGYKEGRYHCFHASCGERSQTEFDRETGFDRVAQTGKMKPWPESIKLNDDGSVPAQLVNLVCVLKDPDLAGGQLMLEWVQLSSNLKTTQLKNRPAS